MKILTNLEEMFFFKMQGKLGNIVSIYLFVAAGIPYVTTYDRCQRNYHLCDIASWEPWSRCSTTCGVGTQIRTQPVCCDSSNTDLKGCLKKCNIPLNTFIANHYEQRKCGNCFNGTYNNITNKCDCFNGYGGSCCNQVVPIMTQKSTTTATLPTPTSRTFTTIKTTKTTPTQMTITTKTPRTRQTSTAVVIATPTTSLTALIQNRQNVSTSSKNSTGRINDKDDCENEPCEYGNCVDEINGFQCECNMFFKGKTCSKMTTWAIAFISLGALGLLCMCCCCLWCIASCDRDDNKKKVKPLQNKPKPMTMGNPNE